MTSPTPDGKFEAEKIALEIMDRVNRDYYFEDGGFIREWLSSDLQKLQEVAYSAGQRAENAACAKLMEEKAHTVEKTMIGLHLSHLIRSRLLAEKQGGE